MFSKLLVLAAMAAEVVNAHGFVTGATVNGKFTAGSDPVWFYQGQNKAKTAGWDALNQDIGFVEPARYGSLDIACHKSATVGANFVSVNAGDTVTLTWSTWPDSHKGPFINYLSNYASTSSGLSFVKIDQSGYDGTKWSTDAFIAGGYKAQTKIPKNLAPGDYVLRHEIIALHGAGSANGAQSYPQCLNLRVGGSGKVKISGGTAPTSLYKATDPGILFNLYTSFSSYPYPGPKVWTSAN